ncbi:MAG TPA: glycosyltransferase family 4 protein [Nitriliruptorales bacterium]
MRTLWITNDLPPRTGGIQQFVQSLLVRVEPEQALVLGPAQPGAAAHDAAQPYRVVRAPGSVVPRPAIVAQVRHLIAEHAPDVVVLGASWPLGEVARRLDGPPIVALTHGLEAGLCGVGLGGLIRRASQPLAAATTISDFTEAKLAPHVRAGRVVRLPPGVDPDVFHPGVDGSPLRRAWGVPDGAPLVACVSRLVPRKGQDVLLRAWPQVAQAQPDAWLAIVGRGPLEGRLRAAARGLERVVISGAVSWAELPAAYAAADVFAMPCRTRLAGTDVEGLGIVYLEAQACGVPAIAGRSGGAPEAVREGETGLTVDGTNPAEVARAVGELLADPERAARMGAAGRRWVEQDWAWDRIADRFRGLLADVTDQA